MVGNLNLSVQKCKISLKINILVKNGKFGNKSTFLSQIEIMINFDGGIKISTLLKPIRSK